MKLASARDLSIIGGAITAATAAAYLAIDDYLTSRPKMNRDQINAASALVPFGVHGELFEVGHEHNGASKSSYIRPASEAEAKSAEAAYEVDEAGVFAVVEDGAHVLPGTPEWDQLIAPQKFGGTAVKYYRVG